MAECACSPPDNVDHGHAQRIPEQRERTLRAAWSQHPERFVHAAPKPPDPPHRGLDQPIDRGNNTGQCSLNRDSRCLDVVDRFRPRHRVALPLAPEPILKGDGASKNDCERNAAKRLLSDVRREHPHLKLVVVEDALASNGPHIKQLEEVELRFILGAKRSDHQALFEWVEATERVSPKAAGHVERTDAKPGIPANGCEWGAGDG